MTTHWDSFLTIYKMGYLVLGMTSLNLDNCFNQKVVTFYDINCQYSQNLVHWIRSNNFISLLDGLQILSGIGIWHVHGHKSECFPQYAPNFIPGAGRVDGEIMETLWSSLNIISPSERGMATPHRQQLLDFQMSDSNFLKMVQMCEWTNVLIRLTCCADMCEALVLSRNLKSAQ